MPRPWPAGSGRAPADELHGLLHGLRPEAVGRRVAGHDLLAAGGQVAQPDLARGRCPAPAPPASMFDSTAQLTCGVPKPRKAHGGRGVGEDRARGDAHVGHLVGTRRGVLALGHHALGDVGVGAQQVVAAGCPGRRSRPSRVKPLRTRISAETRRLAWNDSSSVSTRRTGRPVCEGHEGHQRLQLDVLLAAEAAAGVGRDRRAPWPAAGPSSRAISFCSR